jgi:hypothetical protein
MLSAVEPAAPARQLIQFLACRGKTGFRHAYFKQSGGAMRAARQYAWVEPCLT